jgi:hypothetical protein
MENKELEIYGGIIKIKVDKKFIIFILTNKYNKQIITKYLSNL